MLLSAVVCLLSAVCLLFIVGQVHVGWLGDRLRVARRRVRQNQLPMRQGT